MERGAYVLTDLRLPGHHAAPNRNTGGSNIPGRRAQASIEYLFIVAIAVLVVTLIVIIAQGYMSQVQNKKDTSDVMNSLSDLSSAAKEVYAQGEGSRKLVFVQLPSGYEPDKSSVGNKSIQIRSSGTDYVSLENFNVHGYLPGAPGNYWVWVTSEGNRVRIGPAMMDLSKNRIFLTMERNTTATTSFTVTNAWTKNITVTGTTTWTPTDVSMSGVPYSFYLGANNSETISLQFQANWVAGGTYNGNIGLNANDGSGATETADIPVTVFVTGSTPITQDFSGPIITSMSQIPNPAIKFMPLDIIANASDAQTGNHSIKSCSISADGALWLPMLPIDGAYDSPIEAVHHNYTSGFPLGMHSVRAQCTDALNNVGPMAYYIFNVSEADTLGPIVTSLWRSAYPTTLSNITVGGIGTDAYTGNSDIAGCMVKLDSGDWRNATPTDGVWDSPTENFTYNLGVVSVGYHNAYFQCTDVIGNIGGIYNESFGVVDVDLMIVLDRSGSMAWNVTNATNNQVVPAASTGWSPVKNLSVSTTNGDLANLTVELEASASGCTAYYNATINGVQVATGSRNATTYATLTASINLSAYQQQSFTITLMLKRDKTNCTASNRMFSMQQPPSKMNASQSGAKSFLDVSGNNIQAGLVSFSTTAIPPPQNMQLALMTSANQQTLKNAIDALAASGNTCIECGLDSAADELTSARSRPTANKVIIMLTDGVGNTAKSGSSCSSACTTTDCISCSIAAAEYCRARNITVYTIGFGSDVNDVELTDIALLTNGDYYFAPNTDTLSYIFKNIGK